MSIRVTRPETGYSIIPNEIIQNEDLTALARMLWVYLASLPPDWRPRMEHLQKALGVGRDRMQAACADLEAAGALIRTPDRDAVTGQVFGQVWELRTPACLKNRRAAEPAGGETRQAVNQAPYKVNSSQSKQDTNEIDSSAQLSLLADDRDDASVPAVDQEPKKKPARRSQIGNWQPSEIEKLSAAAQVYGSTNPAALEKVELMVDRFVAHHQAKGSVMANWSAAWVTWYLRQNDFAAQKRY